MAHCFTRHLDWHNYPTHLDLGRLVQHTGTAHPEAGTPPGRERKFQIPSTKFQTDMQPKTQNPKRIVRRGDSVRSSAFTRSSCRCHPEANRCWFLTRFSQFQDRYAEPVDREGFAGLCAAEKLKPALRYRHDFGLVRVVQEE